MHLLLWRHAEAEDGEPDLERPLTARGHRQAQTMAAWIHARAPEGPRILVSPARRTQETAAALALPFATDARLAPTAGAAELLAATGWPEAGGVVLVVGHQPTLGEVAARLLAGQAAPWSLRKGALWWLTRRVRAGHPETVLRAALSPELLS
jgi:phosphohistidine phosphatase